MLSALPNSHYRKLGSPAWSKWVIAQYFGFTQPEFYYIFSSIYDDMTEFPNDYLVQNITAQCHSVQLFIDEAHLLDHEYHSKPLSRYLLQSIHQLNEYVSQNTKIKTRNFALVVISGTFLKSKLFERSMPGIGKISVFTEKQLKEITKIMQYSSFSNLNL